MTHWNTQVWKIAFPWVLRCPNKGIHNREHFKRTRADNTKKVDLSDLVLALHSTLMTGFIYGKELTYSKCDA